MPDPEIISGLSREQVCDVAYRWKVDPRVMFMVAAAATDFWNETRRDVRIISGYRTEAHQAELKKQGRPTADPKLSNHLSCPATAVDVSIGGGLVADSIKRVWGRAVTSQGLRWGYGPVKTGTYLPDGWNHCDNGRRAEQVGLSQYVGGAVPSPAPTLVAAPGGGKPAGSPCPPGTIYRPTFPGSKQYGCYFP